MEGLKSDGKGDWRGMFDPRSDPLDKKSAPVAARLERITSKFYGNVSGITIY